MAKKVNIEINANSKNAESGIKKVTGELNSLAKGVKNSPIAKFGLALGAVGVAFKAVTAAIKGTIQTLKALNDAYLVQAKAEKQLETAAKNNPYLNGKSVKSLKEFASELQKTTAIGDEKLLPFMAQLASAGRTQEEIQKIMAAALDVSATGVMSLDSAVHSLNATYSGTTGQLGKQVAELKNLTKEELANGKAVDIIAEKYKGMAKSVADTVGAGDKLKNSWGDLMETLGKSVSQKLAPLQEKLSGIVDSINNLLSGDKNNYLNDIQGRITSYEFYLKSYQDELKSIAAYTDETSLKRKAQLNQDIYLIGKEIGQLKSQAEQEERRAGRIKKEADEQKKSREETEKALDVATRFNKVKSENEAALEKELLILQTKANVEGKEIDAQEKLNILTKSYIDLVTKDSSLTENSPYAKKRLKELQDYAKGIENVNDTQKKYLETLEKIQKFTDTIGDYFNKFNELSQNITSLVTESITNQTEAEMTALSEQYTDGLISYEEYCNKKKEISRKQAQEEYKISMFNWTSNLLTATANIAQGVAAALSQTPPYSYISAAMTAAAGAVQIATITANKPQPPKFEHGGFIPGSSYSGDNINIRANSGEYVVPTNQQRAFVNAFNSVGGGANVNITIENKNGSSIQKKMDKNGLRLIIDDSVNASMSEGRYTQSMQIANSRSKGASYL